MILNRRRSIADQIYDELRRMVVQLDLQPGQALSEKTTADFFKVSRTPVREAILRLADHGLVTVAPQFGTFIAAIDPDEVRQAQFMREHLEVAIALRLCGMDDLDLSPARDLVIQQNAVASSGDFARFTGLDDQMHAWLFDTAGMGRLWSAIHVKKAHLDRIRFLHVPEPGKIRQVAEQHVAILDAIAARDQATTEARMREHTSGSVKYLETLLVERPELFDAPRHSRARPGAVEGSAPPSPTGPLSGGADVGLVGGRD
ncbi:GntR family transcriptional regulator [Bauldia litoralis]|uniref:GntR family transcriptional regulator n=1 Tax=Bauldia litoralis TaxID=665467 RepID=UPI003267B1EF